MRLNSRHNGAVYFQSFVLVVPDAWNPAECGFSLTPLTPDMSYRTPDIVVDTNDPVHGSSPFVEHSAGCGAQADFIYLPTTYLADMTNATKYSMDFVSLWSEFRYGTFPDETFPGDPLYPNLFHADNVSSPVMPSKQLVLCNGKSADDVIQNHSDFFGIRTDNEPMRAIVPEIMFVKEPRVKYVLAIETTASMEAGEDWKWVNKAAQKLIRYDLPSGTELAVISFNNATRVEHPLVAMDDDGIRAKVADTIPGKYHLSRHNKRCVVCALQTMVLSVLSGSTVGTHLILITRAGSDSLSLTDEKIIAEYVKNYGIRISTIMIPTENHLPFYDDISQISGGYSFLVRRSAFPMDTYVSILDSMESILKQDIDPSSVRVTIHSNDHYTDGEANVTQGTFTLDTSVRNPILGVYVEDTEEHLIKSVSLQDEEGIVYGPYSKLSTTYDIINFKTVNMVGESPLWNPNQSVWRYTIKWFNLGESVNIETRKSIVRVTSSGEASRDEALTLKGWVSRRQAFKGYNPIEVFAKLMKGKSVVSDARVYATIELENQDGALITISKLHLNDDGLGDSDMQTGDGIYSAVLPEYSGPGRYTITVHADDNDGKAYNVLPAAEQGPATALSTECCGSFIDIPKHRRHKLNPFSRTALSSVVHLSTLPTVDIIPPSKIGDLVIELSPDNRTILAAWSSPGRRGYEGEGESEGNRESIHKYRFVYSTNISMLLDSDAEPSILLDMEQPSAFNTKMSQSLEFPLYNQDYFIGVYAFDLAGNQGRISNIEHVYLPAPPPPATPDPIPRLGLPPSTSTDWMMIIAISSGLGALLVLCLFSIAYYFMSSIRSRPDSPSPSSSTTKDDIPHSDHTDSSSCHSDRPASRQLDVKELECQVTNLNQILGDHNRVTPVYWSASQLLSKLESYEQQQQQQQQLRHQQQHHQQQHNTSTERLQRYAYPPHSVACMETPRSPRTTVLNGLDNTSYDAEMLEQRLISKQPPFLKDDAHQGVRTPRVDLHHQTSHLSHNNNSNSSKPFQRNNFYRSSRMMPRNYEEDSYQGFGTPLPPARPDRRIPDEFCVTVSSVSNTSDTDSLSDRLRTGNPVAKPRNITEV